MPYLAINPETRIYYEARQARGDHATFVFINSTGASTATWEGAITETLAKEGYGTLSFDFRGQGKTEFGPNAQLTPAEIIADICTIMKRLAPTNPVFVGLSIGGLHAMRAYLEGTGIKGIVLINTLRKPGALVDWIAELETRLIRLGGTQLLHDAIRPVLAGPEKLSRIRKTHLPEEEYTPMPADTPRLRLAKGVCMADWDIPYEELRIPVLVLSGGQDRLFRLPKDVEELSARIPNCTSRLYENAGHAIPADETVEFCRDLIRFTKEKLTA